MKLYLKSSKNMKHTFHLIYIFATVILSSCSTKNNIYQLTKNYEPDDSALYKSIVAMDSTFFDAYNNCDINLDKYSSFYAEEIEFYHDKGGIMTSKQDIVEGTKKNVCGKVTRELVKGSIEVYPIKDYGAVEMGLHKFHNKEEPNSISKTGRFTIIWKNENNEWKIAKVISLH